MVSKMCFNSLSVYKFSSVRQNAWGVRDMLLVLQSVVLIRSWPARNKNVGRKIGTDDLHGRPLALGAWEVVKRGCGWRIEHEGIG